MALETTWIPFSRSTRSLKPDRFRSSYPQVSRRLFRFEVALPKGHLQWTAFLKHLRLDSATAALNEIGKAIKRLIERTSPRLAREAPSKRSGRLPTAGPLLFGLATTAKFSHHWWEFSILPPLVAESTWKATDDSLDTGGLRRRSVYDIIERQRSIHSISHEPRRSHS